MLVAVILLRAVVLILVLAGAITIALAIAVRRHPPERYRPIATVERPPALEPPRDEDPMDYWDDQIGPDGTTDT